MDHQKNVAEARDVLMRQLSRAIPTKSGGDRSYYLCEKAADAYGDARAQEAREIVNGLLDGNPLNDNPKSLLHGCLEDSVYGSESGEGPKQGAFTHVIKCWSCDMLLHYHTSRSPDIDIGQREHREECPVPAALKFLGRVVEEHEHEYDAPKRGKELSNA